MQEKANRKQKDEGRRSQEMRRRETQQAILSAGMRVLSEEGYGGFSTVQVAIQAGVTRGALAHYYPDRSTLLLAVAQYMIDEGLTNAQQRADQACNVADPIVQFLEESKDYFLTPRYRGMIELAIAAKGDAGIRRELDKIVLKGRVKLDQTWITAFVSAGYSEKNAKTFIDLTRHLFRGLAITKVWLPHKLDIHASIAAWREAAPILLGSARPHHK